MHGATLTAKQAEPEAKKWQGRSLLQVIRTPMFWLHALAIVKRLRLDVAIDETLKDLFERNMFENNLNKTN